MITFIITTIISIWFCYLRIIGYKSKTYQAITHLWTGGLFVASINTAWYWIPFVTLCLVELFCFYRDLE